MTSFRDSKSPSQPAQSPGLQSRSSLIWLALGTFAVGTESFMIAPLLPEIASDLGVGVATAGQLVTVFALAYAISSPILTTFSAAADRRRLLILCMAAFAVANLLAFATGDYMELMAARILLAFAAGLYVPNANALAGALVPPDQRGRALAMISGGTTMAIVFGVPLGALIGNGLGWRMTFAGVAVLSAVATAGLIFGLPRGVGTALPVANLRERLDVARRPAVLSALLVTMLWATGAYTNYTYLASYLSATTGINGAGLSPVLLLWGVAAAIGVFSGGSLSDKFGARRVIVPALLLLALSFASLSASAAWLKPAQALIPVLLAIVIWGMSAWAFFPSQQARLISAGGVATAPVVLSLNASFMFVGFSLGSALGSFTLVYASHVGLGIVGAGFEILALGLVLATGRKPATCAIPAAM